MLLSVALAYTPEVSAKLPVSSFILANSSLRVISYKPWAAHTLQGLTAGSGHRAHLAVVVIVQVPGQEHGVGHGRPHLPVDRVPVDED